MKKTRLLIAGLTFIICSSAFCQTESPEKMKAWNTVRTINRHWAITENMDSLGLYIHQDMVIFSPDSKDRLQRKTSIIDAYSEYAAYAQTVSFKEYNPMVQLYNNNQTAVVTYYYDLVIKIPSGETQKFTGRDMYTLIMDRDRWIAVAQHYSAIPNL